MGSLDLVIPKRGATNLLLRGKQIPAEAVRNDQRYPLALLVLGGWPPLTHHEVAVLLAGLLSEL